MSGARYPVVSAPIRGDNGERGHGAVPKARPYFVWVRPEPKVSATVRGPDHKGLWSKSKPTKLREGVIRTRVE